MTTYIFKIHKTVKLVASLVAQWLRLHASTAGGTGSTPGWGTKILNVEQPKNLKKKNKRTKRFTGLIIFLFLSPLSFPHKNHNVHVSTILWSESMC